MLIPVATDLWNEPIARYLQEVASKDFKIDVTNLKYGPTSIETPYDISMAELFIVKEVERAESMGYDAVIINCFEDPGLRSAREAVDIPVIGPGEASLHLACMLGTRFSIITVGWEYVRHVPTPIVRELGLEARFASERSIPIRVLDIPKNKELTFSKLIEAGRKAIMEDDADVLVLGCTALFGFDKKMQPELKVPIIYPGSVALKIAEILVSLRISHSKLAYPKPLQKERLYPEGYATQRSCDLS